MTIPSIKHWLNGTHQDRHFTEPFPADIIQISDDLQALPMTEQSSMIEALTAGGADTAQVTKLPDF